MKFYLQIYAQNADGSKVLPLALNQNALAYKADPSLLGYVLPDEPNGVGALTAAQCQALYAAAKAAAPNVPVVINLDGGHVMQFSQAGTGPYLAACDIACFDHYPFNYGSLDTPNLAVIAKDLKAWSVDATHPAGKPIIEIFECSNMNIAVQSWCAGTPLAKQMTAPTGSQITSEVNTATAAGVSAVIWFTDKLGVGFISYDSTTPDEQAAMTAVAASLNPPAPPATQPTVAQLKAEIAQP
jgi:hypothetical protein